MVFGTLRTGIEISFPQTEIDIKILSLPVGRGQIPRSKSTKSSKYEMGQEVLTGFADLSLCKLRSPYSKQFHQCDCQSIASNTPNLMSIAPKQGTNKGTSHLLLCIRTFNFELQNVHFCLKSMFCNFETVVAAAVLVSKVSYLMGNILFLIFP